MHIERGMLKRAPLLRCHALHGNGGKDPETTADMVDVGGAWRPGAAEGDVGIIEPGACPLRQFWIEDAVAKRRGRDLLGDDLYLA